MIWQRHLTLAELNAMSEQTLIANLAIRYTRLQEGLLEAEMPVNASTMHAFGLLHGGASVILAETLGSMAGFLASRDGQSVLGTEINASHHQPVTAGTMVRGVCQPLHLAKTTQSWEIIIYDQNGNRCCTSRLSTVIVG